MAGVTIEELGLGFVKTCMEQYWGLCLFPVLFAAGLLFTLCSRKKRPSRVFLYSTVFLFLTVYNPVFVKYVVPKVNFENEYYRFIWLLPVTLGVAYYAVRFVWIFKKKWMKFFAAAAALGVFVFLGNPLVGIVKDFSYVDNLYKVPRELITICDEIHKDTDEELPRVVFDSGLNSMARQYDASIRLVVNRNASIYRAGSTVTGTFDEDSVWYKRQKAIMDVVDYQMRDNLNLFVRALCGTKTDYVAVRSELCDTEFMEKAGCIQIAMAGSYHIYRFDWRKKS